MVFSGADCALDVLGSGPSQPCDTGSIVNKDIRVGSCVDSVCSQPITIVPVIGNMTPSLECLRSGGDLWSLLPVFVFPEPWFLRSVSLHLGHVT